MPVRTEKEKMLAGEIYNCLDPDPEARQKTRKLLDVAAKQAKRQAKQTLAGPVVKKEKVKKEKVKKEKVKTEKVKKVKLTKEELGRQDAKKSSAGAGKKGAS